MSPREARSQPSSLSRRRSNAKRPLVRSDDDDDDNDDEPITTTTQRTKRARMTDPDALSIATNDDSDMDVDVETFRDSARRSVSIVDDSRFLPEDGPRDPSDDTSRKRRRSFVPTSTKKKTHVVYSDEENSSHMERDVVEDDLSDAGLPPSEVSDDDFEHDSPPKRSAPKTKADAVKGRTGKAKPGQSKTMQGKSSKEKEKEILMKDERKQVAPPTTTSRSSSAAAQSQPVELFSNEDPAVDVAEGSKDAFGVSISKKRKLPPIKKTKTASGPTNTSAPTTTTQKPLPPPTQELAKPSLPTSEQRKQALTGVRDIDLGDSKIYAELFKGAGGNTPRSGLKNAEERRKELDKMRDEAKARRAEEAKFTFDLQSQADKIARFEQRLRRENSTVLHPNFIAAKLRDEWEIEKRHRRVTPKEEGEA